MATLTTIPNGFLTIREFMGTETERRYARVQQGLRAVEYLLRVTPGMHHARAFFTILRRVIEGEHIATSVYCDLVPYCQPLANLRQSTLARHPDAHFDF